MKCPNPINVKWFQCWSKRNVFSSTLPTQTLCFSCWLMFGSCGRLFGVKLYLKIVRRHTRAKIHAERHKKTLWHPDPRSLKLGRETLGFDPICLFMWLSFIDCWVLRHKKYIHIFGCLDLKNKNKMLRPQTDNYFRHLSSRRGRIISMGIYRSVPAWLW